MFITVFSFTVYTTYFSPIQPSSGIFYFMYKPLHYTNPTEGSTPTKIALKINLN
jgi:hypothetical protein